MIDVAFDCRLDAKGRDPDSHSPTLRRYHQLLWSKPLPGGKLFHLDISCPKPYLIHRSELGEFQLSSDCITHSYRTRPTISPLVPHLPASLRTFVEPDRWPVSECIVFPSNRRSGKNTINGERGMNRAIGDRFDLTLECIRRHYDGGSSPLASVLERYADFFALFGAFRRYVDFFLLQDLVLESYEAVRFYLPVDNFKSDPLPQDLESYVTYLTGVKAFAEGRSRRLDQWCRENREQCTYASPLRADFRPDENGNRPDDVL